MNIPQFAIVFSAGLLGMMLGSLLFGPLADRFGRKLMIVVSVLIFSGGTVATAFGDTLGYFVAVRLITGVGIGGVLPNLVALTAEFAPARARVFMTSTMYCGFPLGGVAAGLIGSLIVRTVEWSTVFLFFGALTVAIAIPVYLFLPESAEVRSAQSRTESSMKLGITSLFSGGRTVSTLFLWSAMFMTLLIILFMVSWTNALLVREGVPINQAVLYAAFFSLGGILGGILIGGLMDRHKATRVLAAVMALGAIALVSIVWTIVSPGLLFVSMAIAGLAIAGGQIGLQSLAAMLYPKASRSTGVGWALAAGRFGSLIGPLVGGTLIAARWPSATILASMCIPAMVAAASIILLERTLPPAPV